MDGNQKTSRSVNGRAVQLTAGKAEVAVRGGVKIKILASAA